MENKKLKIAFINIYQKNIRRGSERFINDFSRRLINKGYPVDVFSSDSEIIRRLPIIWRLFVDPQGIKIALFTFRILPKLWGEKYNIVIPANGGWQSAIIRIFTWIRGGKMLIIGHSGIGWDDRNNLWSFPDVFVAISQKAEKWARRVNSFVKVRYIPNGVDTILFNPQGSKLKLDLPKPVILCAGALEKNKRIDLVIRAVSKLQKGSLLIVGDGPEKDNLQKLGQDLLNDRFMLTQVPFDKMPEVYRSADLFTLVSSTSYSFELVILEAMASGLGVVVNDDPIRKDIVGSAGFLVNPADLEKYSATLEKALTYNWKDIPVKQAKGYDWEIISRRYEELFLSLI